MTKEWSNLAKIVYRRTYARKDTGVVEKWEDTVERALQGNFRKVLQIPSLREEALIEMPIMRNLMLARKSGPAGRGYWFSGAPAHERIGGVALNNCFSGDTRFIADGKLQPLASLVGQTVQVVCADGVERPALVRSFGTQALNRIRLGMDTRSNLSFTYHATPNHRWLTENGETDELKVGDRIRVKTRQPDESSPSHKSGFVHGLIFGDGSQHTYYPERFQIRLCGAKEAHLLRVEAHVGYVSTSRHPSSDHEPVITLKSPINLKEVPSDAFDWDYQAGFLAGWLAADGSSRGRLCSIDWEAMSWIKDRAPLLGFTVRGDSYDSNLVTNYGNRSRQVRTLTLNPEPASYVVKEIEATGREDVVYCVTEPITHTFTLEGGIATGNCWFVTSESWENFVIAMDLLMLGGGVGLSVEHQFTSKLPRIKKDVTVTHKPTKDADFIVPDSREGWCELFRRVLEAFFVTGKSFTYSTVCVRGYGEAIIGFGGTASGPLPLITFVENLNKVLSQRSGKSVRPIDAMDIICMTGELVVAGNVRRSAILILGDSFDKDYLRAKRWDLGPVPTYRSTANLSVVCEDVENDLSPLFWKTYEHGEPFGIVNRKNIQLYGRMGEFKNDTAIGVNPCAESTLNPFEPCNLTEQALGNIDDAQEFVLSSRMCYRYAKRVTMENYHHAEVQKIIDKNRRVGVGITGCLESPLFNPTTLSDAYLAIQAEDEKYSAQLGVNKSIRTTLIKPSGTMSKVLDQRGEGVHAAYSRYMIQRIRIATNDSLIPLLKASGHYMEPVVKFDGSIDHTTLVVDFYLEAPEGMPCADEGFNTWKQLDVLLMAQKYWADQAVSVTVYYRKEELSEIKAWLAQNLKYLKTISFLCHNDHGFKQAPKEAITKAQYEELSVKIKPIDADKIVGSELESLECAGGVCPIK